MHLYVIRWPEMDAVYHLHPVPAGKSGFTETLPAMPPGTYHLYGDVVFRSGFPETETATLNIPRGMNGGPLGSEDASASPPPVSAGELGTRYKLPDGYTMVWDKPEQLHANAPYNLTFHLLDPHGNPAQDMQPYLGMAGHAAFVKTDGTAFAHTHPEGSAAMPAVMLAQQSTGMTMGSMDPMPGMNMATRAGDLNRLLPLRFPLPRPLSRVRTDEARRRSGDRRLRRTGAVAPIAVALSPSGEPRLAGMKHPVMRDEEIRNPADRNRSRIRDQNRQVHQPHKDMHQRKIPAERDQPIPNMKPQKRSHPGACAVPFRPCVVPVPRKVVQHRKLDSQTGSNKIMMSERMVQHRQRRELHRHAQRPDHVKSHETSDRRHGSGSSR